MTQDYQLAILSFLVQFPKEGIQFLDKLEDSVFDLAEDKITLQLLKKYYKTYKALPSQVVALQFLEEQIKETPNVPDNISKFLHNNFEDIYIPIPEGDVKKLRDSIALEVQDKVIYNTFMEYSEGKLGIDQIFNRLNRLSSLIKSSDQAPHTDSGFLVQDRNKYFKDQVEGCPTFLPDLNVLTAAGGFYSPQLIIFLSGPKHFKTGFLIKLAVEYARDGYKVYYADNENGVRSVRNRAKMALMKCTLSELFDSQIQEDLNDVLYKFGLYMGGDLYFDTYPANMKSIQDVENRLMFLKENHGWEPDIIIYDTIDKFIPSNVKDRDRDLRVKIQLVYQEAINLNEKWKVFAFAPSQVNRNAISKKVFDMRDVSEDFAKIMNCHAAFSICATDKEMEQGERRIVPVAQREGVGYKGMNMARIKIDESRMIIEPLNKDENITDD